MIRALIVPLDSHVRPELMADAISQAAERADHLTVLVPAVLPPTLPISALPPRIAARTTALAASAQDAMEALGVRGRVAITPCRGAAALLQAAGRVDVLVLVGKGGWSVRRAARGVAPELVVVAAPRDGDRSRSGTSRPIPVEGL